jgi:drug/metabolite transporter (DMT)-like permease
VPSAARRDFYARFIFAPLLPYRNLMPQRPLKGRKGARQMWDVILLAAGIGFLIVSVGYVFACDRL